MAGYKVKITLTDTKPSVWRSVILPDQITFGELHRVIQVLFGWADMHMHAFSIEGDDMEIVKDPEASGGPACCEDDLLIDDFLVIESYIDYIYDYDDDWEHRVVLEEIEPEYEQRYVTLLEAEGDNYAEGSGGIWGLLNDPVDGEGDYVRAEDALPSRIPFHAEAVLGRLEEMEFPVHEELTDVGVINSPDDIADLLGIPEEIRDMMENLDPGKDMEKIEEIFTTNPKIKGMFEDICKNLMLYESQTRRETVDELSKLEKAVDEWEDFCSRLESGTEEGQLRFDFESGSDCMVQDGSVQVVREQGKKTIAENLYAYADLRTLKNYCKYLGCSYEQEEMEERALRRHLSERVEQAFLEHPEYVVMPFYRKHWSCFSEFARTGKFRKDPEGCTGISVAIDLGLAEIRYSNDVGVECAYIRLAKNLPELLQGIPDHSADTVLRACESFSESLHGDLIVYGCISFSELYHRYCKREKKKMEFGDFCRNIYWNLRMKELVTTSYVVEEPENSDLTFVAIPEIDVYYICSYIADLMWDWEYKQYGKKAVSDMQNGFNFYYGEWNQLVLVLNRMSPEGENISEDVLDLFYGVLNGADLYELLDEIDDRFGICGVVDSADAWFCVMNVVLHTDLPMLKAHSREEYYQKMREWPPMLAPMDMEMGEDAAEHIEELPGEVQMKMYRILDSRTEPKREIEEIDRQYGGLAEWIYLLTQKYIEWGKLFRARSLAQKLEEMCGKDEDVQGALEAFDVFFGQRMDTMQREVLFGGEQDLRSNVAQFVRSEKKVGRNAPCPCGSGKKYKHCCGK